VFVVYPHQVPIFTSHNNPGRIFVCGSEDRFIAELGGAWILRFGDKFGKRISLFDVQDVYNSLLSVEGSSAQLYVDTAMHVIGYLGQFPTVELVRHIVDSPFSELSPKHAKMRQIFNATLTGRACTIEASISNHYGNYDLPNGRGILS
jgi:hypothetical protein